MRSSSVRPSPLPMFCSHRVRPSCWARAATAPSSLPMNSTPGPVTTGALPRTVSAGSSLGLNHFWVPLPASKAVTRPSLLRTNTRPWATAGAAMTSPGPRARHFALPALMSRAMTWPSSVPITTRFSPTPGPPDRRSFGFFFSFFGSQVQPFLPVCRSMACTPPVIAAANT
ncbi:hypothetical protein G6F60_014499 [Rhizopus arrhizus]|nr:hypothetical protein G6F60_014499 [Rhizopus arrhizus]